MSYRNKIIFGFLIFLTYFFLLIASLHDTGIFWDEPAYYQDSLNVLQWLKTPSLKSIDQFWGPVQLNPPLEKITQAISYEIFHNQLKLTGEINALKLPNLLFASLTVLAVYSFCLKYFNFQTALASSLFLAFLPRFFGHAHFAALDIPLTFFVFLAFWAFWAYKDKFSLVPAIFVGLALLTKITGLLFLAPFLLFYLVYKIFHSVNRLIGYSVNRLIFIILNSFFIILISPLMLFLFWPKLWVNPLKYGLEFFTFFSSRQVPFMYFGQTYLKPPWHFPWVMLGITTPTIILFLCLIGIIIPFLPRRSPNLIGTKAGFPQFPQFPRFPLSLSLFLLLNFLFLPLLLSLPWTSAYDAERLLLPSYPFMAILAALGLNFLLSRLTNLSNLSHLSYLITGLTLTASAYMLLYFYPFTLSSYNLLVGGLKGAAQIGMEPQYTLESYKATLPFLNKNCSKNCLIYAHSNASPYIWYQREGLLRKDIKLDDNYSGISSNAQFYILPMRKSFFNTTAWDFFQKKIPVFSYEINGVPLVNIYQLKSF